MLHQSRTTHDADRLPVMPAMTLSQFCAALGKILADTPEREAPATAARYLPGLLATPDLLAPAQRAVPPKGYGRHCVFACPHETFSVLAMVWPAGIASPIHDHATWCAFGVYEGVLEERRFDPASAAADETHAVPTEVLTHRPGMVAHLPVDAPNIHQMCNPTDRPVITIHVYGGDSNKMGPNLRQVWTA